MACVIDAIEWKHSAVINAPKVVVASDLMVVLGAAFDEVQILRLRRFDKSSVIPKNSNSIIQQSLVVERSGFAGSCLSAGDAGNAFLDEVVSISKVTWWALVSHSATNMPS